MSNEHFYSRFGEIQNSLMELSTNLSSRDVKRAAIGLRRYEKNLPGYEDASSFSNVRAEETKRAEISEALNKIKLPLTDENFQRVSNLLSTPS